MEKLIAKIKVVYFAFIRKQFAKQYPTFSLSNPYYKKVKKGDIRYKYLITTIFVDGIPHEINVMTSRRDEVLQKDDIVLK